MLCNNQIHHTYITYITNRNVSQIIAYLPCVMPSDSVCFIRFCFMEQAMAPHSSTLAWKIPWTEEPGRLQSIGSLRVGQTTEQLHFHFSLSCIGEGNGNPLQRSCWRISGTGEPSGLPSMGLHRVGHDWRDLAAAAALENTPVIPQLFPQPTNGSWLGI